MFSDLVESSFTKKTTQKRWTVALSTMAQGIALAVLILIPLLHTQALESALFHTRILALVPLATQPPPSQPSKAPRSPRLLRGSHILMPPFIPLHAESSRESELPPDVGPGVLSNSVLDEIPSLEMPARSANPSHTVSPQLKVNPPIRVRRGGEVEQAFLIDQIKPVYPLIAVQSHTQGDVVLHAIISKEGNVVELQLISGHPLLVHAAMEAVRQWHYKPTLLNGEPVEVDTTITVSFRLAG